MDRRPTWTDCDEAGDYVVPNLLSPRDLVFRPDNMDETVPHTDYWSCNHFPAFIQVDVYSQRTKADHQGQHRVIIYIYLCRA